MLPVIKKCWITLFVLISLTTKQFCQSPADQLQNWSKLFPIEKIYLHFDRDHYVAGQTAWFKAYLSYQDFPDTISTNLYAELVDSRNQVIDRKVLPVFAGTTHGQFEIPDTLASAYYVVRAYTAVMLNQDPAFLYRRRFFIYGKKPANGSVAQSELRMEFFPEGGNLINGLDNSIAFKGSDHYGMPVDVSGNIYDDKDKLIGPFSSYHDGMGSFAITPQKGTTYYAIVNGKRFQLPSAIEQGIVLSLIPHPDGAFFEIHQYPGNENFQAAYILGQMDNETVFTQSLKNGTDLQGVINTTHLRSGILQVTAFNKAGMPLSERLFFVNNKEYIQPVTLVTDTLNFSARAKNRFHLEFNDTIQGSFSISVTDPDFDGGDREENIYARLLLTDELPGYVHRPAWYFSRDDDSTKTAIDLLMMTNGWRRFKWEELGKTYPPVLYKDPSYITLRGKITMRDSRRPFADKDLLAIITAPPRKRIAQLTHTDAAGNFSIDSLLFFGRARILFTDIRGKKSQYIDVTLSADSVTRNFDLAAISTTEFQPYQQGVTNNIDETDYDAIRKANGIMLENINIKVVKKSPLEQVEDRYTNGIFSGNAERSIDLVNSDEASTYLNVFDYLRARVPGLTIDQDGLDYTVMYRQGATVSALGASTMTMFLDEVETDPSYIASIPANQIALVKVYSSFVGATGNGAGGVLAIYTKKGDDYAKPKGAASYGVYEGYSVMKEFYAPDYSVKKEEGNGDNRITLDWRPDVLSNYINPSIPFSFFNNDRTKKFKVVVEGMTANGKLVCLEKIIQ
jgi:hypothetical protein